MGSNGEDMGMSAAWISGTETVTASKNLVAQQLISLQSNGGAVEISYQRPMQQISRRVIKPLRIFRKSGMHVMYVEAYCETRSEIRIFELSWMTIP